MTNFFVREEEQNPVIRAEVLFSNFLVEHNLPIVAADNASDLFAVMFPPLPKSIVSKQSSSSCLLFTRAWLISFLRFFDFNDGFKAAEVQG